MAASASSSSVPPTYRTIIGPLTTTFTPPAACTTPVLDCPACDAVFLDYACVGGGPGSDGNYIKETSTCWPRASVGAPTPSLPLDGWGFYSPGLVCPTGYTSACTATHGGHSDWNNQFIMTEGETAVGCCPTGYTCTSGYTQACQGTATKGDTLSLSECFWYRSAFPNLQVPATYTGTETTTRKSTITVSKYTLIAPMIEIRWKSSDRTASSTSSSTFHATPASTLNDKGRADSSALPTASKIAIGVVVPLAVIAAVIALFFCYRKRRRRSAHQSYAAGREPTREIHFSDTETSVSKDARHTQLSELDAFDSLHEVDSASNVGRG